MPQKVIYRAIVNSTEVYDLKIGDDAYKSKIKAFVWVKDEAAGAVLDEVLENGLNICFPVHRVIQYMVREE